MACVDEFQHEVYAQKMTDAKERYQVVAFAWKKNICRGEITMEMHFLKLEVSGCRNSIFLCVRSIILIIPLLLWEHLNTISGLLNDREDSLEGLLSDYVQWEEAKAIWNFLMRVI